MFTKLNHFESNRHLVSHVLIFHCEGAKFLRALTATTYNFPRRIPPVEPHIATHFLPNLLCTGKTVNIQVLPQRRVPLSESILSPEHQCPERSIWAFSPHRAPYSRREKSTHTNVISRKSSRTPQRREKSQAHERPWRHPHPRWWSRAWRSGEKVGLASLSRPPFEGSSDWHASPTNSLQVSRWAPKYLRPAISFLPLKSLAQACRMWPSLHRHRQSPCLPAVLGSRTKHNAGWPVDDLQRRKPCSAVASSRGSRDVGVGSTVKHTLKSILLRI